MEEDSVNPDNLYEETIFNIEYVPKHPDKVNY